MRQDVLAAVFLRVKSISLLYCVMLELLHTKSAEGYPVYMEPSTKNCILMKVSDSIPHGYEVKNLSCTIFSVFGHQNPGSGTGSVSAIRKMLDPDPH
jgi:hypothetical protein